MSFGKPHSLALLAGFWLTLLPLGMTVTAASTPATAGFTALRSGRLAARFDDGGIMVSVVDREGAWAWRYRLTAVGRAGTMRPMAPVAPDDLGGRVRYRRPRVVEEYAVREGGIEQTFLLLEAPPGTGPVLLEGEVGGDLRFAGEDRARTGLVFRQKSEEVLAYSHLVVRDADGRVLASSMGCDGGVLRIRIEEEGRYPVLVDPLISLLPAAGPVVLDLDVSAPVPLVDWLLPTPDASASSPYGIDYEDPQLAYPGIEDLAFQRLQEAGAAWYRGGLTWTQIEPELGAGYRFGPIRGWFQNLIVVRGIHPYVLLYSGRSAQRGFFLPPKSGALLQAWQAFVAEAARQLAPLGIQDWEVWNEPDVDQYWPNPDRMAKADPVEYGKFFLDTAKAVKGADPAARVFTGGITPAGLQGLGSGGTFAERMLARIFADPAEGRRSMDGFALHGYRNIPELDSAQGAGSADAEFARLRGILDSYRPAMAIWDTENAYFEIVDDSSPPGGPTPIAVSKWVPRSLLVSRHNGVERIMHFQLPHFASTGFNSKGLVARDAGLTPFPGFHSYLNLAAVFDAQVQPAASAHVFGVPSSPYPLVSYAFARGGTPLLAWWLSSSMPGNYFPRIPDQYLPVGTVALQNPPVLTRPAIFDSALGSITYRPPQTLFRLPVTDYPLVLTEASLLLSRSASTSLFSPNPWGGSRGKGVSASWSAPSSLLSASAVWVRSRRTLCVLLINRDPANAAVIQVQVRGMTRTGTVTEFRVPYRTLTPAPKATRTFSPGGSVFAYSVPANTAVGLAIR